MARRFYSDTGRFTLTCLLFAGFLAHGGDALSPEQLTFFETKIRPVKPWSGRNL